MCINEQKRARGRKEEGSPSRFKTKTFSIDFSPLVGFIYQGVLVWICFDNVADRV